MSGPHVLNAEAQRTKSSRPESWGSEVPETSTTVILLDSKDIIKNSLFFIFFQKDTDNTHSCVLLSGGMYDAGTRVVHCCTSWVIN